MSWYLIRQGGHGIVAIRAYSAQMALCYAVLLLDDAGASSFRVVRYA